MRPPHEKNIRRLQHLNWLKYSVVIVISEFAELNKVQRPNLWPDDYSFMRMSRLVAAQRLRNYYINGGVVWYLTNVDAFRPCWDLISTL